MFFGAPTIAMTCETGYVYLYRFFATPQPGTIIGQITTIYGQTVQLIQTEATAPGGTTLSSVDGRYATVCGLRSSVGGEPVLDVRVVQPGAPSPTGTPPPYPPPYYPPPYNPYSKYPYGKYPYGKYPYPYGKYPYGKYPYGKYSGYGGSPVRFLGPPERRP